MAVQAISATNLMPSQMAVATARIESQIAVAVSRMAFQISPAYSHIAFQISSAFSQMESHISPAFSQTLSQASSAHPTKLSQSSDSFFPRSSIILPRSRLAKKSWIFFPMPSPRLSASAMALVRSSAVSASPALLMSRVLSLSKLASPADVASTTSPIESAVSCADSDDDLNTSPKPKNPARALMPCLIHSTICLTPSMTGWRTVLIMPQRTATPCLMSLRTQVMPSTILLTTVMMPLTSGAVKLPMVVLSCLMLFCIAPEALE